MCPETDDEKEAATPSPPPPALLVVENDVLIRLAVAEHLRGRGFTVIEAASGAEARAVLASGTPVDLVFSDIDMDGPSDGIELARWAGSELPDLPVVLTSGMPRAEAAIAAAGVSVAGFVAKPSRYEDLEALLARLIRRRATG